MQSLFNCLLDSLAQGIILVEKESRVVVWNGWMERLTGLTKTETIGKPVAQVCSSFAEPQFQHRLTDTIVNGQNCFFAGILHKTFVIPRDLENLQEAKRQNMQIEPVYCQDEPFALIQITDVTVQHRQIRCLQNLIKELEINVQAVKEAEESARHKALHDPLTGLYNRYLFYDHLEYLMAKANREGCQLAVLFIDLDGFKAINDTYGHIMGDVLLKEFAVRLKQTVRQTDIVARFGGDEFIVILPTVCDLSEANYVGQKIRKAVDGEFDLRGKTVNITASIGISLYPSDAGNVEDLLNKADRAMYVDKKFGKKYNHNPINPIKE
ncbi:MAG: diguanylate cyclase/phosphodiesterase & domain with sensor(s) [Firmicutes bacterium]|nr:diguanylate cyclase/phosphodiesterase & domain with sensor(s) [Bacillota bacterium]